MPTPCPHFRLLSERLSDLARKFVDDQVQNEKDNPTTFQPDLDRLAAFRLLIHAEIEVFLEAKAKDNIKSVSARVNLSGMRASPELLPLAIALEQVLPLKNTLDVQQHRAFAQNVLGAACKFIADNNGVKERQFTLLSLCAGKTLDQIDSVLSAGLNSFGKDRGDVAHKSVTRCSTLQAPSAELNKARDLVAQIGMYFDVSP